MWTFLFGLLISSFAGGLCVDLDYSHLWLKNNPLADGPLQIISRKEWNAQPSRKELTKLKLPMDIAIIAHTASQSCTTQEACKKQIRTIQELHMKTRRWDDIGYNFLIGGDGAVYVGRGWEFQGAHTIGYNSKSVCIAFMGHFGKTGPPAHQLVAAQKLLEIGVKESKFGANYSLYGHCQLTATESPGAALYNIIKTWPHWHERH